jgi:purine-nucleoside phosphorylase
MAIVLGSGLGEFHNRLENKVSVPYSDVPHMPLTTVIGHGGSLHFGTIDGIKLLCWGGRLHSYEGLESYHITFIANVSA